MPRLYEFTIRYTPAADTPASGDTTHASIEVTCAHQPEDGGYTFAETINAYRWCSGVLGRLAAGALTPRLLQIRDNHDCRSVASGTRPGCSATLFEYQPSSLEASPLLDIQIPYDADHDKWIKLVTKALNDILKADQWQPTPEDETAWAEG